jgi:Protein of unknown function (DUF559)
VGEGGAERSSASSEGVRAASAAPSADRQTHPQFRKEDRREPPMLKRQCGGCSETDGSHVSNFVGKRPFKALFLISSATKSASSLKLMAASTNHPGVTREAVLIAEGFRIARYWNNDVLQRPSAVLEDIFAKLAEP